MAHDKPDGGADSATGGVDAFDVRAASKPSGCLPRCLSLDVRPTKPARSLSDPAQLDEWRLRALAYPFDQEMLTKMSLFSATFTVIKSLCGMGMLSIPFGMAKGGMLTGLICIIVYGLLGAWSYDTIGYCCTITEEYTFTGVWAKATNGRIAWAPEVTAMGLCFAGLTSYICVIGDFVHPCISVLKYGLRAVNAEGKAPLWGPVWIYSAVSLVFVWPLAYQKRFDNVRYTSFFGFCCTFFGFSFVITDAFLNRSEWQGGFSQSWQLFGNSVYDVKVLVEMIAWGLLNHYGACQFYNEWNVGRVTEDNKEEIEKNEAACRIQTPIIIAFSVTMFVYFVVGVFGTLRFGINQPQQIFATDGTKGYDSSNKGAIAARFLMAISALFTCPLVAIAMRISVGKLFFPTWSEGNSKKWRLCSSFGIVLAGTILGSAIHYLKLFTFFIGLSAMVFGGLLMFVYPAIMYINLAPKNLRRWPYKIMLLIGVIMLIVFVPWAIVDKFGQK